MRMSCRFYRVFANLYLFYICSSFSSITWYASSKILLFIYLLFYSMLIRSKHHPSLLLLSIYFSDCKSILPQPTKQMIWNVKLMFHYCQHFVSIIALPQVQKLREKRICSLSLSSSIAFIYFVSLEAVEKKTKRLTSTLNSNWMAK